MFSAATKTGAVAGYQIQRSLRFNSPDSAYLNRTPASAGNRKTFTVSVWVKRSALGSTQVIWEGGSPDTVTTRLFLRFQSDDTLRLATSGAAIFNTTQVFRDASAWYHIIVAMDTTQATAANRARLYVNGSEVTAFSSTSYPGQNDDTGWNMAQAHSIGRTHIDAAGYFNGYMTEIYNIDGQQLTPSSFGQTDPNTGVWGPKAYSGTYGTNGFYVNFSDNSNTTATTLGKDYSGNGNNWTPNNFSVASGAGNDSLVDVPTNWGGDSGAGGNVRGNYCTLNPIDGVGFTATNGNLDVTVSSATGAALGTMSVASGKWYWEVVGTGGGAAYMVGVANANTAATTKSWQGANGWYYYSNNGQKYNNGSSASYGATYSTNDVIGVALDMDAGTVTFYKNGASQGTAYSSFSGLTMQPAVSSATANELYSINFGQRPFAYTAPSGYKALCTQNLPTPAIGATPTTQAGKYFNPVLYVGNTTTKSITGVGFQPDFVWIKDRDRAVNNILQDAVRTAGKTLISNSTNAETGNAGDLISSFNSDGFTVNTNFNGATNDTSTNGSSNYVAWNWKANGSGSSNTAGSITSTVSANTTSGFSVVTYTGTGANATVGHGLGVAPSMVIVKRRDSTGAWPVWHTALANTDYLVLNTTAAKATGATYWNSTTPTSTLFSIGTAGDVNTNTGTYVAYCFAPIAGYSAFGSYIGNNSADGPFVYCGFRPAFVMIKSANQAVPWVIFDTKRSPTNVSFGPLFPNSNSAEGNSTPQCDILSNGFKWRNIDSLSYPGNVNGDTYIYAAFAENPFKYSLAR